MSNHFRFCLFLVFITLPIFIVDKLIHKSSGGSWISLNLEGVLTGAYVLFLIPHIIISSLAHSYFKKSGLLPLHLVSAAVSVLLLVSCFFLYLKINNPLLQKNN